MIFRPKFVSLTALWKLVLLAGLAPALAQPVPQAGTLLEEQRRLQLQREQAAEAQRLRADIPRLGTTTQPAASASEVPRFAVNGFALEGHQRVGEAELQELLVPWRNEAQTLTGLRDAAAAVETFYRARGWLAQVTLPAQDVTDGVVRLQIAEATLGRTVLAATRAPPADHPMASAARAAALSGRAAHLVQTWLPEGEPLSLPDLQRALILADELPGVRVEGSLQAAPHTAAGAQARTDVLLQVMPLPVLRGDLSVDNSASRATGSERVTAVLGLDSPWGHGERLAGALSGTRGSQFGQLQFSVPVAHRGLRVAAALSAIRYQVLDEHNSTTGAAPGGSGQTLNVDLQQPMHRSSQAQWTASFGLERRRQHNRDDVGTLDQLETTSRSEQRWAHLSMQGHVHDQLFSALGGSTQVRVQFAMGKLNLRGSPSDHVAADSGAAATQGANTRLRIDITRTQRLAPAWTARARYSAQLADRNLDAGDRFYLGGSGAVAAYPSGEGGGSRGSMLNLELEHALGTTRWGQFSASAMADLGSVSTFARNHRADGNGPLVEDNRATLHGVAAGLAWRHESGAWARVVVAHRTGGNPQATASGRDSDGSLRHARVWVSSGWSF